VNDSGLSGTLQILIIRIRLTTLVKTNTTGVINMIAGKDKEKIKVIQRSSATPISEFCMSKV